MSKPIQSTYRLYSPGVGITITRANIADEQARRAEGNQRAATPEEIVMGFVTPPEQNSKHFPESKRYKKLMDRANAIMRKG